MTGLESTGITDPFLGLIAVIVVAALATVWALVSSVKGRDETDPLSGLFSPERFEAEIEATERRIAPIKPRGAVLRGHIDHFSHVRTLWGPDTRADAAAKVAQVIRAGVRKGDSVSQIEGLEGDGSFVVLAHGASEAEGSAIAKRLLKRINSTEIDGMASHMRLSASFGVASRAVGESDATWHARAAAALKYAKDTGEEHIVTASEWEEVMLLPAPAPTSNKTEKSDGNIADECDKAERNSRAA